jgi:hypothetical protein
VKNTYYKRNYRPVTRATVNNDCGVPATWVEETCFVGCGQMTPERRNDQKRTK